MFDQYLPQMTPFSRQMLVGIMGLLVLVLAVRITMRLWRKFRLSRIRRSTVARKAVKVRPATKPAPVATVAAKAVERSADSVVAATQPSASESKIAVEPKPWKSPVSFNSSSKSYMFDSPEPGWKGSPIAGHDDYVFGAATPAMAELLPESNERREKLSATLKNAGYYSAHAWHNLAAVRILGIVLPIIGCLSLLVLVPEQAEPFLMVALIALPLVGWSLPTLLVRSKARARLEEMGRGMPDMLDLLNMCVSQGMTVPTALSRVSSELDPVYPALAKELKIVTDQSRVGTLDQALIGFSNRVDIPEVHSFTSLMIQTEQMGTSMSSALTDYSDSMRESFKQRADEKANSATFKMLFPTVLCLMPAVFMFLLGPAVIELNDFFQGRGQQILDSNTTTVETLNRGQR